jgi:hypothetical protein
MIGVQFTCTFEKKRAAGVWFQDNALKVCGDKGINVTDAD